MKTKVQELLDTTGFQPFGKMARLSRECVITEKIDGTNGVIQIADITGVNRKAYENDSTGHWIEDSGIHPAGTLVWEGTNYYVVTAGSRSRWITPRDDNYGFAKWVHDHAAELVALGPGKHYGEWWGSGIQRRYGQTEKRFSLFNTGRWRPEVPHYDGEPVAAKASIPPACCGVVPIIFAGVFDTNMINAIVSELAHNGSIAAPGFDKPEGVVIYHTAAGVYFKKTIENDDAPKGKV
jgi:hypothetical protein